MRRNRRTSATLLLCWALTGLLAACGSSGGGGRSVSGPSANSAPSSPTSSATPADPSKPCSLLSAGEVTGLGGHPPGSETSNDLGKECDFGPWNVTVASPDVSTEAFEYHSETATPVTDLPAPVTKAFHESTWHRLRVETPATRFQVQCLLCGDDENGLLENIARKVLGHL